MLTADGTVGEKTLEKHFAEGAEKALARAMETTFIINGGEECTRYFHVGVNLVPPQGVYTVVVAPQRVLMSSKISFDLGLKISQSRITHDRAEQYRFALALENCVNGVVSAASRARRIRLRHFPSL
jgi:hypothetical protein